MIKKVKPHDDFHALAQLLNESYADVARDFGLTCENCPTNSAFISDETLKIQFEEGREYFYFEDGHQKCGFIAIEPSKYDAGLFYIEKVAVHPNARHKGIGRQLMNFAVARITERGGQRVSIGLINANRILKDWYKGQGFCQPEVKNFAHLPFEVCLMEKVLSDKR